MACLKVGIVSSAKSMDLDRQYWEFLMKIE